MPRPLSLLLRFSLVLVVGVASISLVTSLLVPAVAELPRAASFDPASSIVLPDLVEGSTILDMGGQPMGQLVGTENRTVVALDDISEELRSTVLAVEDADFYRHDGVSARSILRAVQANSDAGGVSQGGSTITQQLVKLSLVGNERSITRKVKEASLALQLEEQFCERTTKQECKDRIFEQYLNLVYLGRGAYGVEAAAQQYFGRPASELGWAESAVIASLIRNPTYYDPISYPEVARERRRIVAGRMVDVGLIDQAEADRIVASPLPTEVQVVASSASAQELSYFERKVRDELLDAEWLAPNEELRRYLIFNGGLTITSTMDARAQFFATLAAEQNPVKERNPEAVAVVAAVEPVTGAVRAVVGETTIEGRGTVELATPTVGRSPGSSFKTFTLLAALEEGYGVRSTISASPAPRSLYDDWLLPDDVTTWPSGCKGGSMDLLRATAGSNNCAFARLQAAVGGEKVVDVARRLGISTLDDDAGDIPSLTLGSASVRPLEMAAAYAAIANDGVYNAPHFVTKVEDRDGNVLYEHEPSAVQAISTDVARRATVALSAVVTGGTYRGGSLPDRRPAAGKTGTNELDDGGNADVWFVGYTPQMATAVWIGDPAGSIDLEGGRVQGGTAAGSVWREFMFPYLEGTPVIEFPEPDSWGRSSYIRDPWNRYSSRSEYSSGSSSSRNRNRWSGSSGGGSATTTTIASNDDDDGGTGGGGGGGGTGGGGGGDGGDGGGGTGGGGGVDPPAPDGGDE
jgi:penicillin-binding protein 1A